jgi:hypothetical protein
LDTSKVYKDVHGDDCTIWQMIKREPEWAANRLQAGEKALERVALLEKAICIYSRERVEIDFENDKEAIDDFLQWAKEE